MLVNAPVVCSMAAETKLQAVPCGTRRGLAAGFEDAIGLSALWPPDQGQSSKKTWKVCDKCSVRVV